MEKCNHRELLFEAFLAGFQHSGEGYNAEYPYGDKGDWEGMIREIREKFDAWFQVEDKLRILD